MSSEPDSRPAEGVSREDLVTLTKARLSAMVVVTTGAGFISAWPKGEPFDFWRLIHTLIGTTLAAFGAAVFNQLMEVDPDKKMRRTADRPLPTGRIPPVAAFGLGWMLSAFGMVHLGKMVNAPSALLAGLTIAVYIFAYTPLKRRSTVNTLVGAVSGAIPPVIGWTAAGGGFDAGAAWWFALLFFWQMPHFYAINWVHREEYRNAGFVMLANDDDSGKKTAMWGVIYAVPLVLLAFWAPVIPIAHWWFVLPGVLTGGYVVMLALRFWKGRDVPSARKLFFGTLMYLPVALLAVLIAKKG